MGIKKGKKITRKNKKHFFLTRNNKKSKNTKKYKTKRRTHYFLGGNNTIQLPNHIDFYKPISGIAQSVPNGLTGSPYTSQNLPSTNGIDGDNNYYANNPYINDISRQMQEARTGGGSRHSKKRRRGRKKLKNGGGIYQEIQNVGRSAFFNIGSLSNTLNGYPAPVNPNPTIQLKT
jgi:hypothetical protein